jgi:hypothetical protein
MNLLLWFLQVLLAAAFFAHGLLLLFPPAAIAEQMYAAMGRAFPAYLGVAEILAAIGLTLPGITGIQPWWAQWAAAGVMVVMIGATIFHATRGEWGSAATTCVLLIVATVVAYARWRVRPILARRVP